MIPIDFSTWGLLSCWVAGFLSPTQPATAAGNLSNFTPSNLASEQLSNPLTLPVYHVRAQPQKAAEMETSPAL